MAYRVRRRRSRSRRVYLTDAQRRSLLFASSGDSFESDGARLAAWRANRESVLDHAATLGRPGWRPEAFWTYDVDEHDVLHDYAKDIRSVNAWAVAAYSGRTPQPTYTTLLRARRLRYLASHGLLLDDEREALLNPSPTRNGEISSWAAEDRDAVLEGLAQRH
jgi:hypothetical protein